MFQDHDSTTDPFAAGAQPRDTAESASPAEGAAAEPRIHARLHEPMRWKQLFRDALTLTLDTLDDAGDRLGRELGLRTTQAKPDDVA